MNIQEYIWNNNHNFYLLSNQEELFNKIKDLNLIGPIHIGSIEGSGKTFLVRRLLNDNSLYLPIHYDLDNFLIKNYNLIVIDNIIDFHIEILSKIKRCIQHCKLLIIVSENYSNSLSDDINSIIRRNFDLNPPDFEELKELTKYISDFFKMKSQDLPKSVTNFQNLIEFFNEIKIEI